MLDVDGIDRGGDAAVLRSVAWEGLCWDEEEE